MRGDAPEHVSEEMYVVWKCDVCWAERTSSGPEDDSMHGWAEDHEAGLMLAAERCTPETRASEGL